jgi:hypothetical protein
MKNSIRKNQINLDPLPNVSAKGAGFLSRLPSVHSQPVLQVEGVAESSQKIYSYDFNLTIQIKVKEFTRKQASLLIGQSLRLVALRGLELLDWMTLECLYSYLLGNKQHYFERKDSKEFELLLLLKIVLSSVSRMNLSNRVQLPEDVQRAILDSRWTPNERTFKSREVSFQLDKFLLVRIVPVDTLIERSKDSIRYSSYCKGYGESGPTGRRKKTRPSAELDGEPVDLEKDNSIKLSFERISQVQDLVLLEIKYNKPRK